MLFWIIALGLMGEPDTERVNPVRPNFQTPWDQLQDVQDMTAAIDRQYKAWINHDMEGYLAAFWRSPFLIYIIDGRSNSKPTQFTEIRVRHGAK
jgi:hypothetical protein